MAMGKAVLASVALGMALALVPAPPAWACSCAEPDPALQIALEIDESEVRPVDSPWGPTSIDSTVDLRGSSVRVVGATPAMLDGLEIEDVPVLASVLDDPEAEDSCGTPHPPAVGSDLELTGTVYDEGDGPFIYSGPCSGGFEVVDQPDLDLSAPPPDDDGGGGGGPSVGPVAIGVGTAAMAGLVGVLALRSRPSG